MDMQPSAFGGTAVSGAGWASASPAMLAERAWHDREQATPNLSSSGDRSKVYGYASFDLMCTHEGRTRIVVHQMRTSRIRKTWLDVLRNTRTRVKR